MSKLDAISGKCIRKPSISITDADVDEVLLTLRKQHMQWKPVKHPARQGDRIELTYNIFLNDQIVETHENTSSYVVLGSGNFHKDLESQSLLAVRKGDLITAKTQLPRNYADRELAEKNVIFRMSVIEVCKPTLPKLTHHFAKELGLSKGGAKTFHKEVRAIMQSKVDSITKRIVRAQIFNILLTEYPLEIDEQEINHEMNLRQETHFNDNLAGHPNALISKMTVEHLRAFAKLNAIMKDIIRTEELVIDTKRLNITVTAMALRTDSPDGTERNYYKNYEELSKVEAEMLEDIVVEHVLNYLNIESVFTTYSEFISTENPSWQFGDFPNWPIIQLRKDNKCEFCGPTKCCQYITQKISTPRSKKDFNHLLWQVSHEKTKIFKDTDGWHLLFETPCTHLQSDGRCGIYESRPTICCDYSVNQCEFDGESEEGWELLFNDHESLLKYCKKRFLKW
jgi:FKBP-type peptidyl-prolyl cis-trans isomerase (trigger factor)/Fe-S-cluster containining protein